MHDQGAGQIVPSSVLRSGVKVYGELESPWASMALGRNPLGVDLSVWSVFPCRHVTSRSSPSAGCILPFSGKLHAFWLPPLLFFFFNSRCRVSSSYFLCSWAFRSSSQCFILAKSSSSCACQARYASSAMSPCSSSVTSISSTSGPRRSWIGRLGIVPLAYSSG